MNKVFKSIKKGTITEEKYWVCWNLGNMILKFCEDSNEFYVGCYVNYKNIFGIAKFREITHMHIDKEDIDSFVNDIDNPDNRINIKHSAFFGDACFSIIDKKDKKENTRTHFYSDL